MESENKGFFGALFDLSFSSLITTKIIKILYVLSIILAAIAYIGWVITGFNADAGIGVFVLLIAGPIGLLLSIIYARVILEIIIVVFRLLETNIAIADVLGAKAVDPTSIAATTQAPPAEPPAPEAEPPHDPPAPPAT